MLSDFHGKNAPFQYWHQKHDKNGPIDNEIHIVRNIHQADARKWIFV